MSRLEAMQDLELSSMCLSANALSKHVSSSSERSVELEARIRTPMLNGRSLPSILKAIDSVSSSFKSWERWTYVESIFGSEDDFRVSVRNRHTLEATKHLSTESLLALFKSNALHESHLKGNTRSSLQRDDVSTPLLSAANSVVKKVIASHSSKEIWTKLVLSEELSLKEQRSLPSLFENSSAFGTVANRTVERMRTVFRDFFIDIVLDIEAQPSTFRNGYRIEIEAIDPKLCKPERFSEVIESVLLCVTSAYNCPFIVTKSMYDHINRGAIRFLRSVMYQKPISITKEQRSILSTGSLKTLGVQRKVIKNRYSVTAKVDGIRAFVVVDVPFIYLVDTKGTLRLIGKMAEETLVRYMEFGTTRNTQVYHPAPLQGRYSRSSHQTVSTEASSDSETNTDSNSDSEREEPSNPDNTAIPEYPEEAALAQEPEDGPNERTSILDVELLGSSPSKPMNSRICAIDAIVYGGRDITDLSLAERLQRASECIEMIRPFLAPSIYVKEYVSYTSFAELISYKEALPNLSDPTDGLVFVNNNGYYRQSFKWKEVCTVDLRYDAATESFLTREGKLIVPKFATVGLPSSGLPEDRCAYLSENLCDGKICEFIVSKHTPLSFIKALSSFGRKAPKFGVKDCNFLLTFYRFRDDRPYANGEKVCNDILYRSLGREVFEGVGAWMMRWHHNTKKQKMYRSAGIRNSILLDIGTGQGGDITKWRKASKVYCVEKDKAMINIMSKRLEQELRTRPKLAKRKIIVINEDVSSHENIISSIEENFDIMSLFFCINMLTKKGLSNLGELAAYGSKQCRIIGMFMSQSLVMEEVKKQQRGEDRSLTGKRSARISNSTFSLDISYSNDSLPETRLTIHGSYVINVAETLYDIADIDGTFEPFGFKRVRLERLSGANMTPNESLLSRMYHLFMYERI